MDGCQLTSIAYTSTAYAPSDGGALHIYDEPARCWRAVQPRAGRLVLFRADHCLHKVEPVMTCGMT
jgi:Rps23 Pro-64 3,4-dihydroxylase Tpa1-like proline 4-hydroxylase